MKRVYPIFIAKNQDDYLVYVPDMNLYSEGKSIAESMDMARDAICLYIIECEDTNLSIPDSSDYETALKITMRKADGKDFKYSTGIRTLVDVDADEYRKKLENYSIKKNCTIPYRLSVKADKAGINYSKVLQDALGKILMDM